MLKGLISKMDVENTCPVQYSFRIDSEKIPLNNLIGEHISIIWTGRVQCICGKNYPKFYRQNFCYQCYWNAPQASQNIFKPELCTADLGIEERDLEWEKNLQLAPHYVYLSNSSGLKVGITRKTQKLTRWMDQGATQAILIAEVPNRRLSGLIEVELKKMVSDKTNWRKMLSGIPDPINLIQEKENCINSIPVELKKYILSDNSITEISYPVHQYPIKIQSVSLQKLNNIQGKIMGIKGQYIILDNSRVFNVRAHQGYIVDFLI